MPRRDVSVAPADERERAVPRAVVCVDCGHRITTTDARTEVGGQHRHVCVNPHGMPFDIGCWATAPGCAHVGSIEAYWSWFAGYTWQIAICGGCGTHLGWRFAAEARSFHGLIVSRVREADQPG